MVIRISATRCPATASLLLALTFSACAGPNGNLKPVDQRAEVVKPGTEAPTDIVHACKKASVHESLATPEAAVNLYIESIAANDFGCAMRAYAAHEHAARVDFTALINYVGMFSAAVQNAPAEYPMFVEMNELRAKAEMAQATKFFVYGLLTDRDPQGSQTVKSDAEVTAFVQAVNPARLATLRVVRIDQPRKSLGLEAQALFKKQATQYGADEMAERVALYELSGQFFWSGFQISRFDKTWKIYKFGSYYAGPPFHDRVKTTVAEYEARIQ